MHIAEGVLSAPVLISGAVLAAGGVALGLKLMDVRQTALTGALAAVFFVGSLIRVPLGLTNAHLILCGILGIMLGWASFPAIFTALVLQAVLFQYGGLTTLGVNTFSMGAAAVCSWYVFHFLLNFSRGTRRFLVAGFCAGFLGVLLASLLAACALAFTSEGFLGAALALLGAHAPIMLAEGFITALTAAFIARVKPRLFSLSVLHS